MESVFSHFILILCLCITMVWRALDLINISPAAVNRSLTPATDKQQDQCDPQQTDRASFSPAHTLLCIPAAHVDSQPLCSELSRLQHSGPRHKRSVNIHDPQRVNLNNFGWPSVTFPLAPQQGFHTHFRFCSMEELYVFKSIWTTRDSKVFLWALRPLMSLIRGWKRNEKATHRRVSSHMVHVNNQKPVKEDKMNPKLLLRNGPHQSETETQIFLLKPGACFSPAGKLES